MNRAHFAPGAAAFVAAALVALLGFDAGADQPAQPEPRPAGNVSLRLLGVNDLHGHLEPPRAGIGGVAWLKAHLDAAERPGRTIRVHAGDMVGASPLVSSWFHDEPAIEAANEIGFDVGTLGNHEFDDGGAEMMRLVRRAAFSTLAANTFDRSGRLVLPPYRIVERAGVPVGFIGVTTPSTPHWLLPQHAAEFRFGDTSDAVNRWVPVLQRQGVEAIVVLAHEGAPTQSGGPLTGPVIDEAREMSDAVDVVIAGHSHSMLNVRVGGKLVVEALSYGTAFDQVDLTIDRSSGDVAEKSAMIPSTGHAGVEPDAALAASVAARVASVAPVGDRVVGHAARPLTRRGGELLELAGDAQREAAGAELAIVSPSAIRSDIDAGPITYAEAFEAQAFDHPLRRATMSGSDIIAMLDGTSLHTSGPDGGLRAEASYTVVASELLAKNGRAGLLREGIRMGTEVEALTEHLKRLATTPSP